MFSLSDATIKQYGGTYQKWWKYCQEKHVSLYNASVFQIMNFLQTLIDNSDCNYSSFNTHRSAISLISLDSIGTNPLLKRFLKGISRKRPQAPRYNYTWDPQPVLKYLGSLEENSLKNVSKKLATLLALITGGRLQTLSLIRLSNIQIKEEKIQIFISDFIKTSLSLKNQPLLNIPFYRDNTKICPATTLIKYIEMTKPLRNPEDFLFITHKKPHKRATKQSISRWVKQALTDSGIDTNIFKPHSTRHSATSAAFRAGISMESICKTAGWSTATSTFAKFYNRPIINSEEFAVKVLNNYSKGK
ncbi:uncharacterized protein LOC126734803 [Anthonomus grandis grandis]|uniref:uncharacterized protein LOC126734803 n=1 Tax=Anthonomus grandis grandis TaxID=2921223 RepID=UPI002165A171|nr:uncharacterized protein LOC126734803 [Anthonomus grandis grandis]